MKRIVKKFISFVTAAAAAASYGAVTASAAHSVKGMSELHYAAPAIYDQAVGLTNGAFFAESDASGNYTGFVRTFNDGTSVKIPNTLGFTDIYNICSNYVFKTGLSNNSGYSLSRPVELYPGSSEKQYTAEKYCSGNGNVVALYKDGQYTVVLNDGSLLENGDLLFDSVFVIDGVLIAKRSEKNYLYDLDGEIISELPDYSGSIVDISAKDSTFILRKPDAITTSGNTKTTEYVYTVVNYKTGAEKTFGLARYGVTDGDELQYVKYYNPSIGFITGLDSKNYVRVFDDKNESTKYYSTADLKETAENKVVKTYKLAYKKAYDESDHSLRWLIYDDKGKTVLSDKCIGDETKDGFMTDLDDIIETGDYMYAALQSGFYVFNRATGSLVFSDKSASAGCLDVNGTSAVFCFGKYTQSDWRYILDVKKTMYYDGSKLTQIKGYNMLKFSGNNIAVRKGEKWGLIDNKTNVLASPRYSSIQYTGVSYLVTNGTKYGVLNENGKVVRSTNINAAGQELYTFNRSAFIMHIGEIGWGREDHNIIVYDSGTGKRLSGIITSPYDTMDIFSNHYPIYSSTDSDYRIITYDRTKTKYGLVTVVNGN